MKIGVIARSISHGGVPKMAIEEVRNLALLGFSSELIFYRRQIFPEFRAEIRTRSFDRGFLKLMNRLLGNILFIFLPFGRALESTVDILSIITVPISLRKKDYDVLLCMDQLAGISGLIASKKGVPYFVYVHEPLFAGSLLGIYRISKFRIIRKLVTALIYNTEKMVLMHATGVFFNSEGTFRWMAEYFPFIKGKGKVIYPGCEPSDKLPEKRENFILSISRWDSNKYPNFILDLAEKIPINFVMAGSWTPPSLLNAFIHNIRKRKLNRKIRILTNISERELKNLFMKAKISIQWTSEGFSMGILEAMAHGLPVITRRGAGVSEIIIDGFDGCIIEEACRDELIALPLTAPQRKPDLDRYLGALENLLDNEKLCELMGRNAWETSKKHQWKEHAKQLVSFIQTKLELSKLSSPNETAK